MFRFTLLTPLLFSLSAYGDIPPDNIRIESTLVGNAPIEIPESDCSSPISNSIVKFLDTGSMCIEGVRAHIDGRGCNTIFWERGSDNEYIFFCKTRDTCDITHVGRFIAYPTSLPAPEIYSRNPAICEDSNYIIFHEQNNVSE